LLGALGRLVRPHGNARRLLPHELEGVEVGRAFECLPGLAAALVVAHLLRRMRTGFEPVAACFDGRALALEWAGGLHQASAQRLLLCPLNPHSYDVGLAAAAVRGVCPRDAAVYGDLLPSLLRAVPFARWGEVSDSWLSHRFGSRTSALDRSVAAVGLVCSESAKSWLAARAAGKDLGAEALIGANVAARGFPLSWEQPQALQAGARFFAAGRVMAARLGLAGAGADEGIDAEISTGAGAGAGVGAGVFALLAAVLGGEADVGSVLWSFAQSALELLALFASLVGRLCPSLGVDRVVRDEAQERCAIALPVAQPQRTCLVAGEPQVPHHVLRHGRINARHDGGLRIVQRVVEIEEPYPLRPARRSGPGERPAKRPHGLSDCGSWCPRRDRS
jgi:hypothetical protein